MFDLKAPCGNCPFRKDKASLFGFSAERLGEIIAAPAFQCHKTVDYDEFDDPELRQGDKPQQCAGLMALLHAVGRPNRIMVFAKIVGELDAAKLDTTNTFASLEDALRAHGNDREPRQ